MNIVNKILPMGFPILLFLVISICQVLGGSLEKCNKYDSSKTRLTECQLELGNCQNQLYDSNAKKLEYEIIALSACKGKLTNEVNEIDRKLRECKERSKKLNSQITCTNAQKNTLIVQIQDLEDKIAELECKLAKLQGNCANQNQVLKDDITGLTQQVGLLSQHEGELKDGIDDCRKDNLTCNNNLVQITIIYDKCTKDLQDMIAADGTCEDLVNKLRDQLNALNAELNECLQSAAGNETAAKLCEEELKKKTDLLNKCIEDLKKCNDDNANTKQLLDECQRELENFKKLFEDCDSELTTCKTEVINCNTEKDALLAECQSQTSGLVLTSLKTGVYYFLLQNSPLTWFEADTFCSVYGMNLVEINNDEENGILANQMLELNFPRKTFYWTGGNDANQEGTWVYSGHGGSAGYFDWFSGEPNNTPPEEDCGVVEIIGNHLKAFDKACNSTEVKGLICEVPEPCASVISIYKPPV